MKNRTMYHSFRGLAALGLVLAVLGATGVQSLAAQSGPTPEGTEITNTATVTFTDANGNSYDPVSGSITITVGFSSGISVVATDALQTPESPTTGAMMAFTIANLGNGLDTVVVSIANSNPDVIDNVAFRIGSTDYASLAALNAALVDLPLAAGDDMVVEVVYDVPFGVGGLEGTLTLTATSVRDGDESDSDATTVAPPLTGTVEVTAADAEVDRLPSNGAQYQATFTVENQQTGSSTFDLVASTGSVITIVSVNGVAGDETDLTLAAGASQNITIVYTVADVAAGTSDVITLTATSQLNATVTDAASTTVNVIRPSLTISKAAFRDDGVTPIGSTDRVAPGETIRYRIQVQNTGTAAAASVQVVDVLPAQVTFVMTSDDGGTPAWSIGESAGTVTATLSDPLATGVIRTFWIHVTIR